MLPEFTLSVCVCVCLCLSVRASWQLYFLDYFATSKLDIDQVNQNKRK